MLAVRVRKPNVSKNFYCHDQPFGSGSRKWKKRHVPKCRIFFLEDHRGFSCRAKILHEPLKINELQWIIQKIFVDFLSISNFYFFSLKFGFTKNLDPEPIHQKAWIRIQIQCIWILRNTGHVTNSLNTVTRLFRLQG